MQMLALYFFPVMMAAAAASDLFTMRIPNLLVLVLVVGFALVALVIGLPFETLAMHLACAVVVLAVGFALFAFGWIGGGDAKLAAAIALWLGFAETGTFLLYAALIGGALTFALLVVRAMPLLPITAGVNWIARLHDKRTGIPYGIALAGGGLMAYPQTLAFAGLA